MTMWSGLDKDKYNALWPYGEAKGEHKDYLQQELPDPSAGAHQTQVS